MKQRITASLLALGLTVGLAACAPKTPVPDETVSPSPDATEAVSPSPDATPDPDPTEGVSTQQPDVTELPDKGTPPPEVTSTPIGDPTAPPDTAQPAPTPAETPAPDPVEPSDTPSIAVPAASEVYAAVSKSAGDTTATMDASSVMENFYDLSADDLEDYVLYIPELSANIEEIFIVRAKPGKASAVKSACETRLAQLQEDADMYPATGAYVASYQLVTEGDWVLFCVCPDSSGAVKAFKNCVE